MNLDKTINHFRKNFSHFMSLLNEYVKIKSISLPEYDIPELKCAAEFGLSLFINAGLKKSELLYIKDAPPYIFGEYEIDKSLPTVLLYAHYDVQPELRLDKWQTPPFESTVKNNRAFGRGTADDKGGIILHLACITSYLKSLGSLPVNVKILIEGEEEAGSPNLPRFIKKYKNKLKSDIIIIADSSNYDEGIPTLTTSLRGLVSFELETKIMKNPLHSGMYGGPIPDPITELAKIIAGLTDKNGKITIPEIYHMITPLSSSERNTLKNLKFNENIFKKQISMIKECKLYSNEKETLNRLWYEPSLLVNAIESGSRKLASNVIMDHAWCKMGIRTVKGMDGNIVLKLISQKIKQLASPFIKVNIKPSTISHSWQTETEHPYFKLAMTALKKSFKKEPLCIGCGGSIPFAYYLSKAFPEAILLLIGIEDPKTKAHSENESLNLKDFKKIIEAEIILLSLLNKNFSV